ncbi:antithrombin III [Thermoflexales bacterium]|nr:antithrombin III [Thermoflexales bacterium]
MKLLAQDIEVRSHSGVEAVVQGNTEFALAFYQKLRTEEGNLFFSPHSISTALAMTYAGARGNTAVQMAQALHCLLEQEQIHPAFASLEAQLSDIGRKGHIQLKVANALWPQVGYPFLEAFLALTKQYYGVRITAVDYGDAETARGIINIWVEEKTENKIQELIPPGLLDALTTLVLVNATYFKGNWASQFDQGRTSNAPFWVTSDKPVQVPMMTQEHEFRYGESDGLQILELPYAGDDLSMVVLLPQEIDGLTQLEDSLAVENLGLWTRNLWETEVLVSLPRFEIAFPFRLDDTLKSIGMVDAFGGSADFSGMDGTKSLFIGAALHKAFVAVNEEGTEAAAATAVTMARGLPTPPPSFRANHPFIFLIRENHTGSILFLGRVVNPA